MVNKVVTVDFLYQINCNYFFEGNQNWRMDNEEDLIYHRSGFCLEVLDDKESLVMANCDRNNERQKWIWKKYEKKN